MQYIPQMYFSDKLSRSNHRVTKLLCYFDNNNLCALKVQLITALIWHLKFFRFRQVAKNSWNCKVWWQIWVCITKETLPRGVEYFKTLENWFICFIHPIFCYWFLVTFGDEITKIRKYYVIFVYILQGKMGKTKKTQKENHAT